jgi:2-(1,2-epoxy-1,2-dihydrophenyl)acetyl-CoA isomerase
VSADHTPGEHLVSLDEHGAVAVITMHRPALTRAAKEELVAVANRAAQDPGIRAVVLTGTGRVFCAGQDLGEHAAALEVDASTAFDTLPEHYHPAVRALMSAPKPVIAAINGTCAGAGISLALACDLRVCSTAAKFVTAFTGIGLTFDSGLSATLARAVGTARASELILLSEPFTAADALAWGLVGRLAEPEQVLDEALSLAAKLAAGPTLAYAEAKRAIQQAALPAVPDVLEGEHRAQARLGLTADHQGAVKAFLAKEKPRFAGH